MSETDLTDLLDQSKKMLQLASENKWAEALEIDEIRQVQFNNLRPLDSMSSLEEIEAYEEILKINRAIYQIGLKVKEHFLHELQDVAKKSAAISEYNKYK